MIRTEYFFQLCPTPLWRIRNRYRLLERKHLPISLNFLVANGVAPSEVEPLTALAAGDRVAEMMLVSVVLLKLFEGEPMQARCGIEAWIRRRGGCPDEILACANEFCQRLLNREENADPAQRVKQRFQTGVSHHRFCLTGSLLFSVNEKKLLRSEPE